MRAAGDLRTLRSSTRTGLESGRDCCQPCLSAHRRLEVRDLDPQADGELGQRHAPGSAEEGCERRVGVCVSGGGWQVEHAVSHGHSTGTLCGEGAPRAAAEVVERVVASLSRRHRAVV